MRECPNCGKTNMPTRKFCIRCGSKLAKMRKKTATPPPAADTHTGKVTTEASLRKTEMEKSEAPSPDTMSVTTGDRWVRPSEIARDRMRTTETKARKTELEKAQEAFARAEEVGIEETGTGVVETRMLRASEVRELMEAAPETLAEPEMEMQAPPPTMMEGSEPLPPEAAELAAPTAPSSTEIEERILGSKSGFVAPDAAKQDAALTRPEQTLPDVPTPSSIPTEFASSKYEGEPPQVPEVSQEATLTYDEISPEGAPEVGKPSSNKKPEMDYVTTCPHCGQVIGLDTFDYPKEVYSAMGEARLKQARFLVVQGKQEKAIEIALHELEKNPPQEPEFGQRPDRSLP